MRAIRRQLKRAQGHLWRGRRRIERARRLAIEKGCGATCIGALTKALADNAEAHQHIDEIAGSLDFTNPHYKPWGRWQARKDT